MGRGRCSLAIAAVLSVGGCGEAPDDDTFAPASTGDGSGTGDVSTTTGSTESTSGGTEVSSTAPADDGSTTVSTVDGSTTDTGGAAMCPAGSRVITGGNLQSEIDETPTNGTLCLDGGMYTLRATVTVDRGLTILGIDEPSITQLNQDIGIRISADDVVLEGLTIAGPGSGTSNDGCGDGPQGIVVDAVSGIVIHRNALSDFQCGIFLTGTSMFEVTENRVENTRYVGIGGSSIHGAAEQHSLIAGNTVLDICADCEIGTNAYGIVATSASSSPVSDYITISDNDVRNTSWECFDTHNGFDVDFLGNYCENPAVVGINVAYPDYDPVSRVEDNVIVLEPGKTNLYNSIVHVGDDYMGSRPPVGGGTVVDNTTMGFGDAGSCGKIFTGTNVMTSGNQCM